MTTRSLTISLGALITSILFFAAAPAHAQTAPTVTGNGVVLLKRLPETLRMVVEITAQGKTAAEAMSNLKSRRAAAEAKLTDLGANKDSIVRGEPHVSIQSDRQRQMEMMVRQRMRAGGKKPAAKTAEPPVSLSATLTAEWPLVAASADDMLVASQALTAKIRAADLAGAKEAQATASAEDQEAAEESAGMTSYEEQGQTPPGEPRFVYIAKISEEDENKALADAFAQAKGQAARLSHAANAELGALSSISGNLAANVPDEDYAYAANAMYQDSGYRYQMMMQRQAMMMAARGGPREASGAEPGTLIHPVNVMATFNLK